MLKLKNTTLAVIGAFIMAFGLYEIHSFSGITEGGVLGLALFFENTFSLSPAISTFVLNVVCYAIGLKILGKAFLFYSAVATIAFSAFYAVLEKTPPVFNLSPYPLLASVLGALFIGIGAGLAVRAGGAPSGDDALAMGLSSAFKLKIETVYLISDLAVLLLSLSYIPIKRIVFSLLTVVLSGKIIGIVQRMNFKSKKHLDKKLNS